jgi:WD40 repeat protein/transcriptional regulator with XRE-family HTH domain
MIQPGPRRGGSDVQGGRMAGQPRDPRMTTFRAWALALRGRAGLTQRELAALTGASERAIQAWEAGLSFPLASRLKALIALYLQRGVFTPGQAAEEAAALWEAAYQEAPRLSAPFDHAWFAQLLASTPAAPAPEPSTDARVPSAPERLVTVVRRTQDWGEAPEVGPLHGRALELDLLSDWVLAEGCRVIAVLGMGGIGKTALAASLAQVVAPRFERVFWRSLRNAPPFDEWLSSAIFFLSAQPVTPAEGEQAQLRLLLELLRQRRCLLVLDNLETVLQPGTPEVTFRTGYEAYGLLLQRLGETSHQSCMLVTSREQPPELVPLEGEHAAVRALRPGPLDEAACRTLLADRGLTGDSGDWASLVARYGGNALALQVVGATIREIFGGDIATFLAQGQAVFGGIRRLLSAQLARLSSTERAALYWLAIEREPITFRQLATDLGPATTLSVALEATEALARRSLLEQGEQGATFTLQPVVLEHATDQLIAAVSMEITGGSPVLLASHLLVKAQAKAYVRRSQERLIAAPLLERLTTAEGDAAATERRLVALLESWRDRSHAEQGYGPGNVVNLLRCLRGDLKGVDLSRLLLRQVYLQEVEAQDASLAGAHLAEPVLAEAFDHPLCVALSADGAHLAAGTFSGEVRLWHLPDRSPILSLQGHSSVVMGIALSGDGRLIASSSLDGTVKLWRAPDGELLATLQRHAGGVRGVALSADGRLVAGGGLDGTVTLWETTSGQALADLKGHDGAVWGVALSADGRLVASGGLDGTVTLWDTTSGRAPVTLQAHTAGVWGVALSENGQVLASGSLDGTIKLWDATSGQVLTTRSGHAGGVWRVALSADGQVVASGGGDGVVRLWEGSSGQPLATLTGHTGTVRGVALTGDGRLAASGSLDGTVKVWETRSGHLLATLQGYAGTIWGVALSGDGDLMASGSLDGIIKLWDAANGAVLATLPGHVGGVWGVALSDDGRVLASGGEDGIVALWDARDGRLLARMRGHTGGVRSVAMSADGSLVASGSLDGSTRLWEIPTGQLLATWQRHTGGVRSVALSADARLVASGGEDAAVRLWEASTERPLATLRGHDGAVWGVALSGDGRLVASGSLDGTVKLWDAASGQVLATLPGHTGGVWGVALSRDGLLLASGGGDSTVKLWDAPSGRLLATLQGHASTVAAVGLSGDGKLVASGGGDGIVQVWEAPSGEHRRALRAERCYERMDITGLTGVTEAQREALQALGAVP